MNAGKEDAEKPPKTEEEEAAEAREAIMGTENVKKTLESKRAQHRREVRIALTLRKKCATFVEMRDEGAFLRECEEEALDLVQTSFGAKLLCSLGFVYRNQATKFSADQAGIDGALDGMGASMSSTSRGVGQWGRKVSSTVKTALAVKSFHDDMKEKMKKIEQQKKEEGEDINESDIEKEFDGDEMQKKVDESLPLILNTVWDYCVDDVEDTSSRACKLLLEDLSVPWHIRYRRCMALRQMGQIFLDAGQRHDLEIDSSAAKLQITNVLQQVATKKK